MNLSFKVPKEKNLGQWLEIATDGLVAPARARIQMEIEAHYAEAVANHIVHQDASKAYAQIFDRPALRSPIIIIHQGVPKGYAELAALADLGDAHVAAKKFHDRYLTESEASKLERFAKLVRGWFWLPINYLLFFSCTYLQKDSLSPSQREYDALSVFVIESLAWVILSTVLFIIAGRQNAGSNIRALVFTTLALLGFWIALLRSMQPNPVFLLAIGLTQLYGIFVFLKFCYKCLRWKQAWPEIPPQNTALS